MPTKTVDLPEWLQPGDRPFQKPFVGVHKDGKYSCAWLKWGQGDNVISLDGDFHVNDLYELVQYVKGQLGGDASDS